MAKSKKFTDDELDYIKDEYIHGKSINTLANEFHVGYGTIQNRLKKMQIFRYVNRRWSEEDISFLKKNYESTDWDIILSRLSKWKKSEIISKASSLNLKRKSFFWDDNDIFILKECYHQKLPIKDIEAKLNYKFTQSAIVTKAHVLGIHQKEVWTFEEDDKLRKIYSVYDMSKICNEFPNRSYDSIIQRAVLLGLSYKTTWTDEEFQFLVDNWEFISIIAITIGAIATAIGLVNAAMAIFSVVSSPISLIILAIIAAIAAIIAIIVLSFAKLLFSISVMSCSILTLVL